MTDEEVLRSNVAIRVRWLRNTALALRDPETRVSEAGYISNFPYSFGGLLDDVADTIEKLLAERKP